MFLSLEGMEMNLFRLRGLHLVLTEVRHRYEVHTGGSIAQWKHSCFPPSRPWLEFRLYRDFFYLLLSLWIVFRSNLSSAQQWISQMQLAVTSRAKCYKKQSCKEFNRSELPRSPIRPFDLLAMLPTQKSVR